MRTDLLIHVEDPGAANWIAVLMPALVVPKFAAAGIADGVARRYLADRGVLLADDDSAPAELIRRHAPRSVLVGTSENPETRGLGLLDAARARGIASLAIVDQPSNVEHRFRGRSTTPFAHAPDRIIVPDRRTADALSALGMAASRIVIVGNPHLDSVRVRGAALAATGRQAVRAGLFGVIDPARPLVTFVSEVGYALNPEGEQWEREGRFAGRGATRYRTAVVLEEVLDALALMTPPPALVLRLHPKNSEREFAAYHQEVAAISHGGDPLAAVFAADLVIGMTSALLEEAHVIGCRTLAVLPRPEERTWLAELADGKIPVVEDRASLRSCLLAMFRGPSIGTAPAKAPALPRLVAEIAASLGAAAPGGAT